MGNNPLSFHSSAQNKAQLWASVQKVHERHGAQGTVCYGEECPLHGPPSTEVQQKTGLPATLVALSGTFANCLEFDQSAFWHDRFFRSVEPGVDLFPIFGQFVDYLFTDKTVGVRATLRSVSVTALFEETVSAVKENSDITIESSRQHFQLMRRKLYEFDTSHPDPTRMTTECEPCIVLADFMQEPSSKGGTDMLMAFASLFQYAPKRGKSWKHLSNKYSEKLLQLLMATRN